MHGPCSGVAAPMQLKADDRLAPHVSALTSGRPKAGLTCRQVNVHVTARSVPGLDLVHRVVHHLPDQVVQAIRACATNVHARSLAHGLQALKDLRVEAVLLVPGERDLAPIGRHPMAALPRRTQPRCTCIFHGKVAVCSINCSSCQQQMSFKRQCKQASISRPPIHIA